ncbi:hypothetical protein CAEBREN_03775 [Caenorhabditis brenneri]|uniref:Uncharacterized protein n=1 Tax=Caenorhabditis brenneri TaxID=135651 RepID=G0N4H3_CAEBE|nr:hypothetical protein CAEBREN_03775 [Caenorhabditis brenneri]
MPFWASNEEQVIERRPDSWIARYKRNNGNLFGAPFFAFPASNAVGPEVSRENHYIEALDIIDLPPVKTKLVKSVQNGESSSNCSFDQSEQIPFKEIDYIKEMAKALREKYKNTKTGEYKCHMCNTGKQVKCLRQAAYKLWLDSLETGNTGKCMSDGFVKMVSFSNKKRRDGEKMFYGSPITKPIVLPVDANSVVLWDEFRNYFEYFMSTYYPETCTFAVEAKIPLSNLGIKNSKEPSIFQESWARMEHNLNSTDEEPRTKCVKATIIVELEEPEEATTRQLSFFHDVYVPIPDSVIMKKPDSKSVNYGDN